jgi:phage repressor protein C with HTH and peptisase S24 domain
MSLADRIQIRLNELGFSQQELATRAGVSQPAIYKLVSGQSKTTRKLLEIADALQCDPEWLNTGVSRSYGLSGNKQPSSFDIPFYDVQFSAGFGSVADDNGAYETLEVPEQLLTMMGVSPANACIVKVKGDSMEPTLHNDESIVIDTSVIKPLSNQLYAFEFEGDLKVKRFVKEFSGYWTIKSDNKNNPAYQDQTIAQDNVDRLRIIGRVAGLLGRAF